jgi:hypothetical protein
MVTSVKCPVCGFPVLAPAPGEIVNCPHCLAGLEGITGVTIPTSVFVGTLCFIAGVILGPAVLSSTREGAMRLERIASDRLRGSKG